ncbi:MAG: hypothetical protein QNJ14_12770 [Woeseiaceae bacterium]|nr:hypothetical protein [Woeseiaceae bacterium]
MTDTFDDKLDRAARQLSVEISPERDLWPGIAEAIEPAPRRSRWTPMLAQAAAVVLLVGASSGITYILTKDSGPAMQISPELVFEQASFGKDYNLGPEFQVARNGLRAELEAEMARLSPEARQDVQANLDLIHTAIVDINAALEQQPDSVVLQQKLLQAYREELTLLRRVGGLTRNVMTRNDI